MTSLHLFSRSSLCSVFVESALDSIVFVVLTLGKNMCFTGMFGTAFFTVWQRLSSYEIGVCVSRVCPMRSLVITVFSFLFAICGHSLVVVFISLSFLLFRSVQILMQCLRSWDIVGASGLLCRAACFAMRSAHSFPCICESVQVSSRKQCAYVLCNGV